MRPPTYPVVFKVRGKQVGRVFVRDIAEVPYIAGQQACIRETIVVAENEHGDRIAVGDPQIGGMTV